MSIKKCINNHYILVVDLLFRFLWGFEQTLSIKHIQYNSSQTVCAIDMNTAIKCCLLSRCLQLRQSESAII